MAVPLSEQIEEVEKTVRERERFWLGADGNKISRGRLLEETAISKTERMRAAAATLSWLGRNMGWIRCEAEARRMRDLDERQQAGASAARAGREETAKPEPDEFDAPDEIDTDQSDLDDAGSDDTPEFDAAPDTDEQILAYAEALPITREMRRHFPGAEITGVRTVNGGDI